MYKLKAFGVIAALIDNTRSVVAPIGELSPRAMTYAREKEYLNSASAPGHTLVVFSSKREGEVEQTDPVLAAQILEVNEWIYRHALSGGFNPSSESFRVAFIQEFGTQYSIWSIGAMVQAQPNVWMPTVVEFRDIVNDELQYRVWFSTEVFEQQFDEYQIEIVPPVADLDVFFEGSNAVKSALRSQTHDITMERVQAIKEEFPESFIRGEMFEWFDPIDPTNRALRIETYWTPIIYGIAGLNVDAIKEALRDYILANSSYTRDEWAEIFPEIFTSTEFIFVPMYGKYSIPNRVLEAGLYSSNVSILESLETLKSFVRGDYYTDEFIDNVAEVFGAPFKAISVAVTGGPKNRDNINTLTLRYPDYINVDSTSLDFSRMAPETRRFVLALIEMLGVAEEMTPDSAVPVKFTRLVRDGVLYLAHTLDRFQLIVLSKYSFEDPLLAGHGQQEPQI